MNNTITTWLMGVALICLSVGCSHTVRKANDSTVANVEDIADDDAANLNVGGDTESAPVEIVDTCGLRIYFPNYTKIDLVCGKMPSKEDKSVIMFAEAAFTGELLEEFNHKNISSSHVSNGVYYSGYLCKRSRGAFTFYNGKPNFVYKDGFQKVPWPKYLECALRDAANNGGYGFAQEMMIHEGKVIKYTRPARNSNEFRALCLLEEKVAIVDSKGVMKFGDFINNLQKAGTTEALYLDMGSGWNYSWYRDADDNPVEIHTTPTKYATNWITFYR